MVTGLQPGQENPKAAQSCRAAKWLALTSARKFILPAGT